jgi:hypothetical protein
MAIIILWQKEILLSKQKIEKEHPITLVEETKNYYLKHNKTLCNFNMYYVPPLSNIFQVKQIKNNMIYFQPFSIARIKIQDISILSNSISNATNTLLPKRRIS